MRKKINIFIAVFLFLLFGYILIIDPYLHPSFGENYKSVSWLPQEATDISFNKNWVQKTYEFEISEKGFLEWLDKANFHNAKVHIISPDNTDTHEKIFRYNQSIEEDYNKTVAKISDGYFCNYLSPSGNGGGYWIGYDRKAKRAYYFSSSH